MQIWAAMLANLLITLVKSKINGLGISQIWFL